MIQIKRIINTFYTSNTFVLSMDGSTNVWLVDCGDYALQIRPLLKGRTIKGVLLTHTHSDHIYGLEEVIKDFPEVMIYTNDFGKKALGDPKLNVSRYHTEIPDLAIECKENTIVVDEGIEVNLFTGISAEILFTPGHDKSSLCYVIDNHLFTGDSYIPGERLVALFPNSNKKKAKESYDRLVELGKNYTLCPGHGPMVRKNEK